MAAPKSPQGYEKYMPDDKLKAKSEEIDLFHLDFDWREFRKHGMRFPYGIQESALTQKDASPTPSETLKTRVARVVSNSTFQELLRDWQKLNIERNPNQLNENVDKNADINCDSESCGCLSLNRLIFVLNTYHDWCGMTPPRNGHTNSSLSDLSMVDIIDNLSDYSQTDLYNDYCHMLDYHSSTHSPNMSSKNANYSCETTDHARISEHAMIVSEAATRFAVQNGFKRTEYYNTTQAQIEYDTWVASNCSTNYWRNVNGKGCDLINGLWDVDAENEVNDITGCRNRTVESSSIGLIAIDDDGQMALATYSNGLNHNIAGRVSDAAIPGAGG
eukprot:1008381_1